MSNPPVEELRERLLAFVAFRAERLRGDEKGEAQVFLDRLFQAFGHGGVFEAGAQLEARIRRDDNHGTSFADLVWKPRVLIEMKKAGRDLSKDYRQAFNYWIRAVPDRPQYVVLCNFDELWIYNLAHQLDEPIDRVTIGDLPRRWEALAFLLPEEAEPVFHNDLVAVTRESAARVSALFNHLVERGTDRGQAQRFVLQALMAMFAEDIALLPRHFFTMAIEECLAGGSTYDLIFGLFREMNAAGVTPAGRYEGTPYFNGGLYREVQPIELERREIELLHHASGEDWSQVRPAIFGTLFEQSLEKDARHAYGAHFTAEADIQKIVLPTIVTPWSERIEAAATIAELERLQNELVQVRVLDPTCGCGNFLYVAYREMRRLEKRIEERVSERRRSEGLGAQTRMTFLSTRQFFGMDINAFAIEIAKVTLMLARKLAADELGDERNVLPLDDLDGNFEAADSALHSWPAFDVCIGNPPYLGRRKLNEERGVSYSAALADAYPTVSGVSDYVSYWFRRAHDLLHDGGRAGLVGTNTIRQGATREATLDYITDNGGVIFDAVSSQPWSGDAAVHVSIVNWGKNVDVSPKVLWINDGELRMEVDNINSALSPEVDLRRAKDLRSNKDPKVLFQGVTPGHTGGFVLSPDRADALIAADPTSAAVVHPYLIGDDLTGDGLPSRFIIDIPEGDAIRARAVAPGAYEHVRNHVMEDRRAAANKEKDANEELLKARPNARANWHHKGFFARWWQLSYRREDMVEAIAVLDRYIAISRVAAVERPSFYAFVDPAITPGDALQVFAFDDDYSFGILQSAIHRSWFAERCSTLETRLRYTPNTVWNTFPWPQAPSPDQVHAVVAAAEEILDYRQSNLERGIALVTQYNSLRDPGMNRLRQLHDTLDGAVFAAYGFSDEEDVLAQILALNETIADSEASGLPVRKPGPEGLDGTRVTNYRITVTDQGAQYAA